ncbi:MAG: UbiD family decarboxylase [Chloroflexota bacterium]
MAYRDLREWMARLESEGELVRLADEVRLEPDIGAIGRAILNTGGPAVWAQRLFGYDETRSLVIGLAATPSRIGMALGLPKDAPMSEQKRLWLSAYDRQPLKPRMVKDAPCRENIVSGDDVNLFDFPIMRLNTGDPAPFIIKTSVISRDPDSDWVNSGTYRMQVLGRNKTAMYAARRKDWGEHYEKYRQMGREMECAVALGTEPVLGMVSGTRLPPGCGEYEFAGALRGEPEELIMAESVNLPVPASAEIVLEGIVKPDESAFEGNFGEGLGAYSHAVMAPVFHVKTITYRHNPIFDTIYIGRPPTESSRFFLMTNSAMLEQELKVKFPQITEVALLWPAMKNVVIQGRWGHRGEPNKVIAAFIGSTTAAYDAKLVTIVDEDIDPWNVTDVMWAIAGRSQGDKDFIIYPGCRSDLDPSQGVDGLSCVVGINATKPRPPYDRIVAQWVTHPEGTGDWEARIAKLARGCK